MLNETIILLRSAGIIRNESLAVRLASCTRTRRRRAGWSCRVRACTYRSSSAREEAARVLQHCNTRRPHRIHRVLGYTPCALRVCRSFEPLHLVQTNFAHDTGRPSRRTRYAIDLYKCTLLCGIQGVAALYAGHLDSVRGTPGTLSIYVYTAKSKIMWFGLTIASLCYNI